MTRMEPKTFHCVAGNDRLLLLLTVLLELLTATALIVFGLISHRVWLEILGVVIVLAALALLLLRRTAPPKTELLSVDRDGFYFHPLTGADLEADYDWLRTAELFSTGKSKRALLLHPADPSGWEENLPETERRKKRKCDLLFGAPIALQESMLESLCGPSPSLDQLATALNDNRLLWALSAPAGTQRLTTSMVLDNDVILYQIGDEAQLCSEGICARLADRDGIWLFPFSELSLAAAMASAEDGNRKILLALIYRGGDFVALSDCDPLFVPLYEHLSGMENFDQQAFIRATAKTGTQLVSFYRPSKAEQ